MRPTTRYLHLFLRSLGLIHFINFASLLFQILPLIGSQGISPLATNLLRTAELAQNHPALVAIFPSVFWIDSSDACLVGSLVLGLFAALHLVLCWNVVHSRLCVLCCWVVLLSFNTTGGEFLAFPWDWLLLEATLLSLCVPKLNTNGKLAMQTDPWVRRSLIWLCLRFYLAMAIEKLPMLNQNPHWRNWTYMSRFYETEQPMPTRLSWYLHNAPMVVHKFSCLSTFVIELGAPLLGLCGSRRARNVGAGGMILFQVPIMLTGNYAILNLLTIALCVPLFEYESVVDTREVKAAPTPTQTSVPTLESSTGSSTGSGSAEESKILTPTQQLPWWFHLLLVLHAAVGLLFLLRTLESLDYLANANWIFNSNTYATSFVSRIVPRELLMVAAAWKVCNGYGGVFHDSFAHTGKIVLRLEGSIDGIDWEEMQWRWHVQDVNEVPLLVAPYFPRLDHTVFYYINGIGFNNINPLMPFHNRGFSGVWFVSFLQKLLEHDKHVWSLLRPFSNSNISLEDIRYIRGERALYRFTNTTNSSSNAWWELVHTEMFLPMVCIDSVDCNNCFALCMLFTQNNQQYCDAFVERTQCHLTWLHDAADPTRLLFLHDEFLWHWIDSLPLSYLENLQFLYGLRNGKVEQVEERFSDGKLLRWGLNVLNSCANGNLVHDVCQRLL